MFLSLIAVIFETETYEKAGKNGERVGIAAERRIANKKKRQKENF